MTRAQKAFQLALHMRHWARTAELPEYAEKMFQAADDLERRANELESLDMAARFTVPPLAKAA